MSRLHVGSCGPWIYLSIHFYIFIFETQPKRMMNLNLTIIQLEFKNGKISTTLIFFLLENNLFMQQILSLLSLLSY